jgi:sialic acid synthase SpsE
MDIAAIALGANLVEKTITEDRMTRSVEHVMSIEPHEMTDFIKTIREVETALGSNRRIMTSEEVEKRDQIRRSVFLKSDVKAGQKLDECDIEFRRPGFGITPDQYEKISSGVIKTDLLAGKMLTMNDIAFD